MLGSIYMNIVSNQQEEVEDLSSGRIAGDCTGHNKNKQSEVLEMTKQKGLHDE